MSEGLLRWFGDAQASVGQLLSFGSFIKSIMNNLQDSSLIFL
jgi:hypothetical protein